MPPPKRIIKTDNPLGIKINAVMLERGMPGDYAKLAGIFDVTTPSAREWVQKGRMAKRHYATLVRWSGRPLSWWFDAPSPPGDAGHIVSENVPAFVTSQRPDDWPFASISRREFWGLPEQARREIEAFAMGVMSQARAQQKNNAA